MTLMHRRLSHRDPFCFYADIHSAWTRRAKNSVVLIIRHAEDGGEGQDLAPRGHERAEAYKNYFLNFTVDSKRLEPGVIFAAKDSKKSTGRV